jgi:hypothetical protein
MGANRADIVAEHQHQAQALASLKMEKAKIDAQRRGVVLLLAAGIHTTRAG